MNNAGTMASMIEAAMQKEKGPKDRFTLTGQNSSAVMYEQESGREFVMYDSPNGEQVKVYGPWNEYAVSVDEEGRDMIADEDFPIMRNEKGEYILDQEGFEQAPSQREEGDRGMQEGAEPSMQEMASMMGEGGAEQGMQEEPQMGMGGMSVRDKIMMAMGGRIKRNMY